MLPQAPAKMHGRRRRGLPGLRRWATDATLTLTVSIRPSSVQLPQSGLDSACNWAENFFLKRSSRYDLYL